MFSAVSRWRAPFSLAYFCGQHKSLRGLKSDVYTLVVRLLRALHLALWFSWVKIIIERLFVPQVPFEKFSAVSRDERPDRNEVYEVVVRFECAKVLFALWLSCYEI